MSFFGFPAWFLSPLLRSAIISITRVERTRKTKDDNRNRQQEEDFALLTRRGHFSGAVENYLRSPQRGQCCKLSESSNCADVFRPLVHLFSSLDAKLFASFTPLYSIRVGEKFGLSKKLERRRKLSVFSFHHVDLALATFLEKPLSPNIRDFVKIMLKREKQTST